MPHTGNKASIFDRPEHQLTAEEKDEQLDAWIAASPTLSNTNKKWSFCLRLREKQYE